MGRPRKEIYTGDYTIGQDVPRDMPLDGDARIEPQEIEVVGGPVIDDLAPALAFMEEPVDVLVHDSADRNAEPIVETGVNGRVQFFIRGQTQTVKRKFVECLARAKTTTYSQQKYSDANGNDAIRNVPHTALRYPFSVVNDRNPNGAAWLKKVLAEA